MSKNVFAIGSRTITGDVGKLMLAGEVDVVDANIEKVYGAGDMRVRNSYIEKFRAAGDVTAHDSTFDDFKSAGEVKLTGVCRANLFTAIGDLHADYLDCNILRNGANKVTINKNQGHVTINRTTKRSDYNGINPNNIFSYTGSFKAITFENILPFRFNCEYKFRNIISKALMVYDGVLECERLYSFGPLQMEGVNAECIYLLTNEYTKLETVVGTKIVITDRLYFDHEFNVIPRTLKERDYTRDLVRSNKIMEIDIIEGDEITIDNVKAKSVSGINVTIGDMCVIDKVEYRDNITVSKKAIVGEVIRL